jgi:26S proteasome regulatory subunit N1
MAAVGTNEALKYALAGTRTGITQWGHEYLRTLSGEISSEYKKRVEANLGTDLPDLQFLIDSIVPYNMTHNAEPEAVDLLLEINRLPMLIDVKRTVRWVAVWGAQLRPSVFVSAKLRGIFSGCG